MAEWNQGSMLVGEANKLVNINDYWTNVKINKHSYMLVVWIIIAKSTSLLKFVPCIYTIKVH
jgi:hypothetical protein